MEIFKKTQNRAFYEVRRQRSCRGTKSALQSSSGILYRGTKSALQSSSGIPCRGRELCSAALQRHVWDFGMSCRAEQTMAASLPSDFVTRQRCEAAVGLRTTAVYAAAALQRGLRKFRYVTKTRNRRNSLLTTAFHAVGLRPTAAGEQSSAPTEQSLLPCSAASAAVGLCNYFVTEGPSVPWASNCCRSYGF
jgi:hypothetical protein